MGRHPTGQNNGTVGPRARRNQAILAKLNKGTLPLASTTTFTPAFTLDEHEEAANKLYAELSELAKQGGPPADIDIHTIDDSTLSSKLGDKDTAIPKKKVYSEEEQLVAGIQLANLVFRNGKLSVLELRESIKLALTSTTKTANWNDLFIQKIVSYHENDCENNDYLHRLADMPDIPAVVGAMLVNNRYPTIPATDIEEAKKTHWRIFLHCRRYCKD